MDARLIEQYCRDLPGKTHNCPMQWHKDFLRRATSYAVSYCPSMLRYIDRAYADLDRAVDNGDGSFTIQ